MKNSLWNYGQPAYAFHKPEMQPVTFFRDRAGARSNSARTGRSTGMSHQGIFSLEISHSF